MKRTALISTFSASGAAMALSAITSILLARYLEPEGRGALLALTFWPGLLAAVFSLSVNEAAAYHIARAIRTEGVSGGESHASSALLLQVLIAAAASILAVSLLPSLVPSNRGENLNTVLCYAALFTPMTILDLHFKAVLQGRGAFRAFNFVRLCQPLVYVIVLLFLVWMRRLQVETVMAGILLPIAVSLAAGAAFGITRLSTATFASAREMLLTGWKFHLANLLLYAGAEGDKFIVLQLMDDKNMGYYAVGIALSVLGSGFVVQSLVLVLTREMAAAATDGERRAVLIHNVHHASLLLLLLNGAAAALAPWWLPILYGAEFEPVVPVTMVLFLMCAIKGLRQIVDRAMRAAANTGIGMLGEVATLGGLLVFAWIGARTGELQGLAWGMVAAQSASLAVVVIGAAQSLGFAHSELLPFRKFNIMRLFTVAARELRAARQRWGG